MASDTVAKISNRECRPVRRRTVAIMGAGAARRRTPPSRRAPPAGPDQHGQPARITESHPGQIDDDPAGLRPWQADEPLTHDGCGRDVDFAADRHDGVTTLTPDGKLRARRDMIDFMRRHLRQPISVPGRTGSSCAQGDADVTVGAREAPARPRLPCATCRAHDAGRLTCR